jgi:hypothetical protein
MRSTHTASETCIDITLTHNALTQADRQQMWRNFLSTVKSKDVELEEADLVKLARWGSDGKQIKSASKTARILASKKAEPLDAKQLGAVLKSRRKALGMMNTVAEVDEMVKIDARTNETAPRRIRESWRK